MLGNVKKDVESAPAEKGWKYLFLLQSIKSGLIADTQVDTEIKNLKVQIENSVFSNKEMTSSS